MENFIRQIAQEHFEAHRQAFINFIRKGFTLNGDEITDIYNDVWIDVIDNIRRGRTERVGNWKAYVFSLGWKRAYKLVTRRAEMESIDISEGGELAFQAFCIGKEEEDACNMRHLERIESVMMELERLPEKHRAVLELYYIKGMSAAEIAKEMGYSGARSVITVKKRSLGLLQERLGAA